MKLHLGCGNLKLDDFLNIDILSNNAEIKLDFTNLSLFNNSNIEEIYVSHALEHFKRQEVINLILEWNRVLKLDGVLRIAVPDFEKVVKMYLKNKDISELIGFLSGGQKDEYDIHYINFDIYILEKLLKACGFDNIERYNATDFLGNKDDYSKCYLPHMDIDKGELMSLNIICKKTKNIDINNLILDETLKTFTKFKL
jgi:predicted SAM-dependent methyltransferase